MPSQKQINVTIKGTLNGGGGVSKEKRQISEHKATESPVKSVTSPQKKPSLLQTVSKYYHYQITQQTINTIKETAGVVYNRFMNVRENYLGQQNVQIAKSYVSNAVKIHSSMVAGAKGAASAFAGGAGGAAAAGGAVAGLALAVIAMEVKTSAEMQNYHEQYNAQNIQTNVTRFRMGLIDAGRGTEN